MQPIPTRHTTLKSATLSEKNLEVVAKYLKKQVRQEWPSEFLTSDLMSYLAIADGEAVGRVKFEMMEVGLLSMRSRPL